MSSNLEVPSPGISPPRTDRLVDSVVCLLALTMVQRMVGFVRSILFCRWLSPDQLGQWDLAFSFLMLAGPLAVVALPGTFGRYVEHYRARGQLRGLLRKSGFFCAAMAAAVGLVLYLASGSMSSLIFGSGEESRLVIVLAGVLVTVILFNYLTDLFTGLRNGRMVAFLQTINGLGFAGFSVGLLCIDATVVHVIVAYGAACILTGLVAWGPLRHVWRAAPEDQPLAHGQLWPKLLPFAAWVWIGSFLGNIFHLVDRTMIVHCAGLPSDEALALVGNYHSARLVPLLLESMAGLVATMALPYLSHDWEEGRRGLVGARMNLLLKLSGFGLTLAGIAILAVAPWLFSVAFQGKFDAARAILPGTLVYCVWFALVLLANNYLFCIEKARLVSVALCGGLLVNVGLNFVLLPRWGLSGAVFSTSVAHAVTLALVCGLGARHGLRLHWGTWLALALPVVLVAGAWASAAVVAGLVLACAGSHCWLTDEEKRLVLEECREYLARVRRWVPWFVPSAVTPN